MRVLIRVFWQQPDDGDRVVRGKRGRLKVVVRDIEGARCTRSPSAKQSGVVIDLARRLDAFTVGGLHGGALRNRTCRKAQCRRKWPIRSSLIGLSATPPECGLGAV